LFVPNVGLNEDDIKELKEDSEYTNILRTARFNKGWDEALDFLVKRNFAFKTSLTSFFVSDAGRIYLLRLVDEYETK